MLPDAASPGPASLMMLLAWFGSPVALPVLAKLVIKGTNSASRLWLGLPHGADAGRGAAGPAPGACTCC